MDERSLHHSALLEQVPTRTEFRVKCGHIIIHSVSPSSDSFAPSFILFWTDPIDVTCAIIHSCVGGSLGVGPGQLALDPHHCLFKQVLVLARHLPILVEAHHLLDVGVGGC